MQDKGERLDLCKCNHQSYKHLGETGACNECDGCEYFTEMSRDAFNEEIRKIDFEMYQNTKEIMNKELNKAFTEKIKEVNNRQLTSLQIRKELAEYMIFTLRGLLDEQTLKGVFRQAYKRLKREIYGNQSK